MMNSEILNLKEILIMKQMKTFLGALFIIVALYSMIINLTVLFTLVLDMNKQPATEEQMPDRIIINPEDLGINEGLNEVMM